MADFITVADTGTFEFTEKKSRFIGHCFPIADEREAEVCIQKIKKEFWDARHNCYAFRVGNSARSSDDGEPSGTAGAPILNVLMHTGMENVLVVVTRYFGGVLLGAGGLIRAYSKAASGALKNAGIIRMVHCTKVSVETPYSLYQAADRCFRSCQIVPEAVYTENVTLSAFVPDDQVDALVRSIVDKTEGKCAPILGETDYVPFVEQNPQGFMEEETDEEV